MASHSGYVQAPDAEQAVKEAIAQYGIINPQEQARLRPAGERGQLVALTDISVCPGNFIGIPNPTV